MIGMITQEHITGLILAGGRGSRMGNLDKGLQPLHGAPLVQHVLQRLQPQVGSVCINANRHLTTYAELACAVWPDEIPGFAGPLAGLHAGLTHCHTPYLLTVPCDCPYLPLDLGTRLAAGLVRESADLAVVVSGADQRLQPVFALMQTSVLAGLDDFLHNGGRKVESWLSSLHVARVAFADELAFRNINTLQELKNCE